eukprot:5434852-Pyramimonas_sp.AAC.1
MCSSTRVILAVSPSGHLFIVKFGGYVLSCPWLVPRCVARGRVESSATMRHAGDLESGRRAGRLVRSPLWAVFVSEHAFG